MNANFFQTTLGMFTLFILGAGVIYIIIAGFSGNWNQFQSTSSSNVRLLAGNIQK